MGSQNRTVFVEREGLQEKLAEWLECCRTMKQAYDLANGFNARGDIEHRFEARIGERYIKIFVSEYSIKTDTLFNGSIYAFIDRTNGDVLKPAGVKAPAKNARGNLFDDLNGMGCMGPYGVLNAR